MEKITCFHCGTESESFTIFDDKTFCCKGCETVYDILMVNNLDNYYQVENNPGVRKNERHTAINYDYLDNEEIQNSLLDFKDGKIAKITLHIPSIHCSSCIWLLENLNKLNKGVIHSSVNFTAKLAHITFDQQIIDLKNLALLLDSVNYKPNFLKNDKKNSTVAKHKRGLLIRIGIAGFAFGNVMLLSFPTYLSLNETGLSVKMVHYFSYFSLIISIPVIFYCASDYFLSAWKNIQRKIINIDLPIALGILVIFVRSSYEILAQTGPGYLDSLTGLVFFLLTGKWFQDGTYKALNFESDYTSYFPMGALKIEGENEKIAPINQLKPGDKIRVRNQEIIPADSILQSELATIDYSFITGESLPVQKQKGDLLYAGGRQMGNGIELILVKDVKTSYLTQLWKDNSATVVESNFISETLSSVSKYFTICILLISFVTAIFWWIVDPSILLHAFTSVLIVACPCALAMTVPFTFGHARRILGKNQLYLKHSSVIEGLSRANTIVFDKTGTLTDPYSSDIKEHLQNASEENKSIIKSLANNSLHPISRSIVQYLNSSKLMSVIHFNELQGKGISGEVNGFKVVMGSADFVGINNSVEQQGSMVHVSINSEYSGYFKIQNKFRNGWEVLLNKLSESYDVHILSGDNDAERTKFNSVLLKSENIHFNQSPTDKLNYILKLKSEGRRVIMVGDGLNDAGALLKSNVGISVSDDIYQFSPASDAIIQSDNLQETFRFLKFAKSAHKIVVISIILSFLYNVVGITMACMGNLSPVVAAVLMPLSSISVVTFTSLSANLLAKYRNL